MSHPATLPGEKLLAECRLELTRRSGPGGQHRNKVETAVVLHHLPSGVKAEASERRSQAENRGVALFRLRLKLALQIRTEPADARPSRLWQSRLAGSRINLAATHNDFPALLAEALDRLTALYMDPKQAAGVLGCSSSQLVKLLKKEPRALALVNSYRQEQGLRPLL